VTVHSPRRPALLQETSPTVHASTKSHSKYSPSQTVSLIPHHSISPTHFQLMFTPSLIHDKIENKEIKKMAPPFYT